MGFSFLSLPDISRSFQSISMSDDNTYSFFGGGNVVSCFHELEGWLLFAPLPIKMAGTHPLTPLFLTPKLLCTR